MTTAAKIVTVVVFALFPANAANVVQQAPIAIQKTWYETQTKINIQLIVFKLKKAYNP
jgi:hypothetical protein